MQKIGQKSHTIIPNSRIRLNQTSKAQSAKMLKLANQHIGWILQPLELRNILTHARNSHNQHLRNLI